jgi:hypothetical protein
MRSFPLSFKSVVILALTSVYLEILTVNCVQWLSANQGGYGLWRNLLHWRFGDKAFCKNPVDKSLTIRQNMKCFFVKQYILLLKNAGSEEL